MLKEYVFVTVSLIDELEKINKSILKLSNLYKVFKYIVIVPEAEIRKFESKLSLFYSYFPIWIAWFKYTSSFVFQF